MRLSKSMWQTYKEVPADAEIPSHRLLIRAGLVHKTGSGLYSYLPFGLRVLQKIEKVIREELDTAGCQEISMSIITPGELWKRSGRWDSMGTEMLRIQDKGTRDLCFSPTNEESCSDIVASLAKSYKHLPIHLYQINTKFRDELRPRFGLMRAREFVMKDGYSFHVNKECLDQTYVRMFDSYTNIFKRLGLEFAAVLADGGNMASAEQKTHEFQVIADTGEDTLVVAPGYAANLEKATTERSGIEFDCSPNSGMESLSTIGKSSIIEVADYLAVPAHHVLKSLVWKYQLDGEMKYLIACVLGDDDVNPVKIAAMFAGENHQPATDKDLLELGLPKGSIGPLLGSEHEHLDVVVDLAVSDAANYVIGAGKAETHLKGFKICRDLPNVERGDLRLSALGDVTVDGQEPIQIKKGIEVGHIFQLGDKYTKQMNIQVTNRDGRPVHPLMGCYGIGVSRLMAAIIEQSHDEKGIVWPLGLAPFQIHMIIIGKSSEFIDSALEVYTELKQAGYDVLCDDRVGGPGVKFKDADLLGIPVQLVFGERDFVANGTYSVVERASGQKTAIKPTEMKDHLASLFDRL